MLSRTAALSRVCLTCRRSLARRGATGATLVAYNSASQWSRRCASDWAGAAQSKERIEALISGSLDDSKTNVEKHKRGGSRGRPRRGKRKPNRQDDEPAPWELPSDDSHKPPAQTSADLPVLPEAVKPIPEPEGTDAAVQSDHPAGESIAVASDSLIDESVAATPSREFRHDLLQHHRLGVDALGKPVEALIIKNPNKMKRSRKAAVLLEEEAGSSGVPLRWEDVLPRDEGPEFDFSEEVRANIDELRPKDTTVVRRKDFEKLMDALVDGFTREQLVGYFNKGDWEHTLKANDTPSYPWMVKLGTWQAAQSNQWGSLKPKQQQAVLILTALWKLEIQEQVEGLGRTLIWVQPDVFRLIARPPSRVIESLSADYLDKSNNERISAKIEESRLAIYARKSTAATVLARMDEIARSITSKQVSVQHIPGDNLAEPVLEELGRITNTLLQHKKNGSELSISWLADKDRPETGTSDGAEAVPSKRTEDPADVVLRLLAGHETNAESSQLHVISTFQKSKTRKGLLVEHHRERRGMSWRDKLRQWSRYVNPITKETVVETKLPNLSREVSLPDVTPKSTDDETTILTSATFGHILHAGQDARQAKLAKNRRILSPVVPHPAALTSITADSENDVAQSTTIILNFASDPAQASGFSNALPKIQLRLPVNPDTDLSAFAFPADSTLEAVISQQLIDVLLPDEGLDVRLSQQHLLPLDANQQSLKDFLAASDFNLLAGRLRTPSHIRFSLPSKWLSADQTRSAQNQAEDVPYTFMGLEIHQAVDLEWRGHTLRYNSIEAGQHGGQRQELSLHAGPPGTRQQQDVALGSADSFLRLVEEVATGKHFSWDEGYKLMQDRADEEFSLDMMDESLGGEETLPQDPSADETTALGDTLDTASGEDAGEARASVSDATEHTACFSETSSPRTEKNEDGETQRP